MSNSSNARGWLKLAKDIQSDVDEAGLGISPSESDEGDLPLQTLVQQFDLRITSADLSNASRQLFVHGHYASAVENAFKCLNNAVKEKSKASNDGDALMRRVFSANSPILKLNSLQSESDQNEQRGYMDIFAGVMSGIRNPRAHEHEIVDDPDVALEMLIIANHLMNKLENSTLALSDDSQ